MASAYSNLLRPRLFIIACLLTLTWGLFFWFSPSPRSPAPPLPPAPTRLTPAPPTLEHFVHDLVNEHRLTQGRPPLEFSRELSTIAHVHSRHMASHTTPYGHGGFEDRAKSVSHFMPYRGIAENVAKINGGGEGGEAKRAVVGWLQSPGHRANIEGDFTLTGIGISQSWDGTYYFTQLFMTPAAAVEPPQSHQRGRELQGAGGRG